MIYLATVAFGNIVVFLEYVKIQGNTLQRPRIYEDFSLVHAGIASYTLYFWQLVDTLASLLGYNTFTYNVD